MTPCKTPTESRKWQSLSILESMLQQVPGSFHYHQQRAPLFQCRHLLTALLLLVTTYCALANADGESLPTGEQADMAADDAQTAQPQPDSTPDLETALLLNIQATDKADAYDWLKTQKSRYPNDPLYYDLHSRLAMELGDYAGAVTALKRLVALQPGHMGGRLDLVLALQLEGRSYEAREALIDLNRRLKHVPNPPAAVRKQLAELNDLLLEPMTAEDYGFRGHLELSGGYDSNANRGADSSIMTFNFPGGIPVNIELAPDSLKTADDFGQVDVSLEYGQRGSKCRLYGCHNWLAGAIFRQYNQLDKYDQRYYYLGYKYQLAGDSGREVSAMVRQIDVTDLDLNGSGEQNSAVVEYRQLLPGMRNVVGLGRFEVIDEADNRPNAQLTSLGLQGAFSWPWSQSFRRSNQQLIWSALASYHRREDYGPGDAERYRLTLGYPFSLGRKIQGVLQASYQYRTDSNEYNPLLFAGKHRVDKEILLGARLQYQLARNWHLLANLSYESVHSSIALLDVTRTQAQLGIRYGF